MLIKLTLILEHFIYAILLEKNSLCYYNFNLSKSHSEIWWKKREKYHSRDFTFKDFIVSWCLDHSEIKKKSPGNSLSSRENTVFNNCETKSNVQHGAKWHHTSYIAD